MPRPNPHPNHSIEARIQALTLIDSGHHVDEASAITGISRSVIYALRRKAKERGYDPAISRIIKTEYVVDASRKGRPKVITVSLEQQVLGIVQKDRNGRERTCKDLAAEFGVSDMTIWRILKKNGLRKRKPSMKPGLTEAMKEARLQFCLQHRHLGIEFWRRVVWTDETSVVLGHRRGGVRVRRTATERYNKTCIRRRWKGVSEFMFWGAWTYDRKGPCHIWKAETAKEKKTAIEDLKQMNEANESIAKINWELETGIKRMNLRRKPGGQPPTWKYDKAHGAAVREGKKGGIDWYRYQKEILIKKLLPFAKECGPTTLVQEDKASAHASKHQQQVFLNWNVMRLFWPGNSPDLNAIEGCWPYLKRVTTKKGAPRTRKTMEEAWLKAWAELKQSQIQHWIERIPRHIERIIELGGGNEYREGRFDGDSRNKVNRGHHIWS